MSAIDGSMNGKESGQGRGRQRPSGGVARKRLARAVNLAVTIAFAATLVSPHLTYTLQEIRWAWIVFPVWLLSALWASQRLPLGIRRQLATRGSEYALLLAWLLVVFLNALLARGYTSDLHLLGTLTLGMVVLVDLFYSSQGERAYARLLTGILLAFGFEVLLSLPTLWNEPGLARRTMEIDVTAQLLRYAGLGGVGQYGHYTGYAMALPAFIGHALTTQGILRTTLLGLCLAMGVAIGLSTFMGAVLLMLLGFGLFAVATLLFTGRRLGFLLLFAAAVSLGTLAWSLAIADSAQGSYLRDKVLVQFSGIQSRGLVLGDQTGRTRLWMASLDTVTSHPLFGVGPSTNRANPNLITKVGGHSSWLDQPAEYGLIGFAPYLGFLILAFRRRWRLAFARPRDLRAVGQFISLLLFVLGGVYNPVVVILTMFPFVYIVILGGPRPENHRTVPPLERSRVRRAPRSKGSTGPTASRQPQSARLQP